MSDSTHAIFENAFAPSRLDTGQSMQGRGNFGYNFGPRGLTIFGALNQTTRDDVAERVPAAQI